MIMKTPTLVITTQLIFSSLSILLTCTSLDKLTPSQSIRDGDTIISIAESFEMGFFSPGNSENRYFGIWYKTKQESELAVVWVASSESPLNDSSGVLRVTMEGALILLNSANSIIWSSNSSRTVNNPIAKLLDSGNLVVKDADDGDDPSEFIWQSFNFPVDTLLPGMKFGLNLEVGLNWYIQSWKSKDDPSKGAFIFGIDSSGYPQFFLRKEANELFRLGPWNGVQFSGNPNMFPDNSYNFTFILDEKEMYYIYNLLDESIKTRFVLNSNGVLQRMISTDGAETWHLYLTLPINCEIYGFCGAYSICSNTAGCSCLRGFVPSSENWSTDISDGCVRRKPLDCHRGDGFLKQSSIKLPDTRNSWFNLSMNLKDCETTCSKNCTCVAYANIDVRGRGSGCLLWFGKLVDIEEVTQNGQNLYGRIAASEIALFQASRRWTKTKRVIVVFVVLTGTLIFMMAIILYIWKKKKRQPTEQGGIRLQGYYQKMKNEDIELTLFDLDEIIIATNNFAINNKLGEGGFGPVYKGVLDGGQEIAVKVLSRNSSQGVEEFNNEVTCIAKLQHRNLVKILGCCIQEEEWMLIYEYMPNNSLDTFVFDESRRTLLDWPKRFNIINGIARGLLYLHQDSRLRIIHRDLKGSNILLDSEMNPKISDFGLARIFEENETGAKTKRVVGTYGYMPPEYAIHGHFSVKSDIFSFGVLVLEIVNGKRNREFCHPDSHNLLAHAWKLYKEGKTTELIDESLQNSCNLGEIFRSIQVGLLCVQQRAEDRPHMSNVVLMLGGEGMLAQPKQPAYYTDKGVLEASSDNEKCSANMVTISLFGGR